MQLRSVNSGTLSEVAALLSLSLIWLLLDGSPAAYGRPIAPVSVKNLTNAADTIVVGEVVDVHIVGPGRIETATGKTYPAELMSTTVRVDQVLKGSAVEPSIQIEYLHNSNWDQGPITDGLLPKTYRMVFLKRSLGKYKFADPEYASLPLPRTRVPGVPRPAQDDIYAQVVSYLAETLFARDLPAEERTRCLFDLTVPNDPSPYLTEVLESALDRSAAAAAADPDFRNDLIAALVRRKNTKALQRLQAILFSSAAGEQVGSRGNLIFALQFVDGKSAVPILTRALTLPDGELRQDAARSLQNAGQAAPQEAIDALLAAIDDPDREVQFYVMQSLGGLNRELYWRPHSSNPKEDSGDPYWNECLDHWRRFATLRSAVGIHQQ